MKRLSQVPDARPARRSAPLLRLRSQHKALKKLVASWRKEDAQEQRETFEYLREALDADRPSYRKLFH